MNEKLGLHILGEIKRVGTEYVSVPGVVQLGYVLDRKGEYGRKAGDLFVDPGDVIPDVIVDGKKLMVFLHGKMVGGDWDGWWLVRMPTEYRRNVLYDLVVVDPSTIGYDRQRFEVGWGDMVTGYEVCHRLDRFSGTVK